MGTYNLHIRYIKVFLKHLSMGKRPTMNIDKDFSRKTLAIGPFLIIKLSLMYAAKVVYNILCYLLSPLKQKISDHNSVIVNMKKNLIYWKLSLIHSERTRYKIHTINHLVAHESGKR